MKVRLLGLLLVLVCGFGYAADQEALVETTASVRDDGHGKPAETQLKRASGKKIDLRHLPRAKPKQQERPELEEPELHPIELPGGPQPTPSFPIPGPSAPAPAPNNVFEGLDRFNFGAGSPPDTNGDVGPTYYIQTVNTSVGVFRKSDGFLEAGFSFNTLMSQGNFGNLCDTDNFGDPVVLYDTFEDRWIITDFAFKLDGGGNVIAPAFQCFAASMSGDPLTGGWNFYSRQVFDALNDYPKFGIWPDGVYMSANLFGFGAGGSFKNSRVWAFNKAQMYAGSPTVQAVSFDVGGGDFTVIPSNARLQTGTPPPGTPNFFVSTWQFLNALTVYKFHVDWDRISLSSFTGPDVPFAPTSWPNAAVGNAQQPATANLLDVLQIRAMVQSQYSNIGGAESLWLPHTVRRANTSGFAAPRWYQVDVTGGTVAANVVQAATWDPDGANSNHRYMPSVALDRAGDMAMGYSISNSTTTFPSMAYAGRLAGDPANTFSQTEQTFFTGTASQTGSTRWGDYSSMTLDPDGCTFWYTSEYANPADQTFNHRWVTKFGSFGPFPGCTPVGNGGTVSGTITVTPGGAPVSGATVQLGTRSATTNGSGSYSFSGIPAGTYPSIAASKPGFGSTSAATVVVTDNTTTTEDLALAAAAANACLTDTTQSDFLTGVGTALDLNASPGDVTLSNAPASDQANTAGTTTGTSFGTPGWTGQTFIAGITGALAKADVQVFCSGCSATPPDLTLSVRATSAGLPTGADLASATIPGSTFASGSTVLYTASFASPPTLISGTQYALVLRPVSVPIVGGYFWIRSLPTTYASGSRVLSADSGGSWSADTTRDFNFRTYMVAGYGSPGELVSSLKDADPATNYTPHWTTLSWNAATPANTALAFQVAPSNSEFGPFNFVGPDGTAATYFTTSGASLSQFNGSRYLKYRALLTTSSGAVTPALNDATVCYADNPPAALSITKSDGLASVAPGSSFVYTITASNAGPGIATAATVADTFPASPVTCSSWTCQGSGGGVCSASGSGDINDTVDLPSGASVTYSVDCSLGLAATLGSNVSNTATLTPLATDVVDPAPADNTAIDQDGVARNATTTTLLSSQNPSVFGDGVTFTATVSVDAPNIGTPTGTVTFKDGVSTLGTTAVSSGSATYPTSALGVGGHTITATYNGDASNDVSTSTGLVQNVTGTVNGSVNGLSGSGLVLRLTYGPSSTTADLPVAAAATTFSFSAALAFGDAYSVAVLTNPTDPSQTCNVSNASGTMPAGNVGTVVVSCSTDKYKLGVDVSGLTGAGLSMQLNGDSALPVATNGTHYFATQLFSGSDYVVSVGAQPGGQICTPASPTGTIAGADVVVTVSCITAAASLSLSVDDSTLYARYGQVLDYLVTLSNSGNATATNVAVASSASPGLDAANASWTCFGAGGGASCTASGSGAFADTATLPPDRALTWLVSMPVFFGTSENDVTLSITATGASNASDLDTIVIFRDGFDVLYGNGALPTSAAIGILGGTANQVFTLPPSSGNAIQDVLSLRSAGTEIRVQSVTIGKVTEVRLLVDNGGQQRTSAWTSARPGASLIVASVVGRNAPSLILLEGGAASLAVPLTK